jgi:hypothetical protein
MYEVIKFLVEDQPGQKIKLATLEITNHLIYKLVQISKPRDTINNRNDPNSILNKICSLCLDFFEKQNNILINDPLMRLFDKVMILNQSCSFELGQRQFKIFEKFFGTSLKAKLNYIFNKLALDNIPEAY